jgi:hypothetical protein
MTVLHRLVDWLRPTQNGTKISYADPLHAGRHPFQVYMLTISIITGVPILFGNIGAGSMAREIPFWLAFCWGLALFLGSAVALIGCYWHRDYATALALERAGLGFVGLAAVVYAVVIMFAAGSSSPPSRIIPIGIIGAYGFSCLRRARDIGRILHSALKELRDNNG